jgi:hypothetical protein
MDLRVPVANIPLGPMGLANIPLDLRHMEKRVFFVLLSLPSMILFTMLGASKEKERTEERRGPV